jgi:hypothetical protein
MTAISRALLTGVAALFLATGTAHADCCFMAPITPAGRAFYDAAKRHFGHSFSSVGLWQTQTWKDCVSDPELGCVQRECWWQAPPEDQKDECKTKPEVVVVVKDTRYLGLDDGKIYLICRYRTKPIRFYKCWAWEGD